MGSRFTPKRWFIMGKDDTMSYPPLLQCVAKDDPKTGDRIVAGVHWDYDCYGAAFHQWNCTKHLMNCPLELLLIHCILMPNSCYLIFVSTYHCRVTPLGPPMVGP